MANLEQLKESANQKCFAKGHKLGQWQFVNGKRAFNECQRCNRWVSISTETGYIGGTATKLECLRGEDEHSISS